MSLSRRRFLGGLLAGAAGTVVGCDDGGDGTADPTTTTAGPEAAPSTTVAGSTDLPPDLAAVVLPSDPFTLGVASGDPEPTSVVLWTRLAPQPLVPGGGMPEGVDAIAVEVATDDTFTGLVATGRFPVDTERGHSVHAVVEGLEPATTYAYRFRIGTYASPVGRTRTAPAADADVPVAIAVASCQRYGDGWYVAHRDMAAADLDAVVWLGDYIYEGDDELVRPLPPGGPTESEDLDGYRFRYATARLDPDLTANHHAHPWVVTWDDHEVRNNHTGEAGSVPVARRAAAYQAWWEHMPVRVPPPEITTFRLHRSVRLGANLELLVLDTRQHRSAPGCGGNLVEATCADLDDGTRTVLGPQQEEWLVGEAAASDARWTAVAQSVVVARAVVLDQLNADAWDGYPAARRRLLEALAPVRNAVFLTGDIHVQLVADVDDDGGAVVASELVTASTTSIVAPLYRDLVGFLPLAVPTIRHAAVAHGWIRCDVDADGWRATYREVADVADPASAVTDGPAFVIADGTPGARRA